jgi:dTDP-4-dehydrorhamnose 3,5-epimerase
MASNLTITKTEVDGCLVVENGIFTDQRGAFFECWNRQQFIAAELPIEWPQDNFSVSHIGVMRGLHIQRTNPQGKLVRCFRGSVLDICLDLRAESPTFLKWHCEILRGGKALYLPPGTAHGFLAQEPESIVYYKCTTLYDGASDGGVNWADKSLDLHLLVTDLRIRSEKDKGLPSIAEWCADPRGLTYGERV